jgi:hypothetical protein
MKLCSNRSTAGAKSPPEKLTSPCRTSGFRVRAEDARPGMTASLNRHQQRDAEHDQRDAA